MNLTTEQLAHREHQGYPPAAFQSFLQLRNSVTLGSSLAFADLSAKGKSQTSPLSPVSLNDLQNLGLKVTVLKATVHSTPLVLKNQQSRKRGHGSLLCAVSWFNPPPPSSAIPALCC